MASIVSLSFLSSFLFTERMLFHLLLLQQTICIHLFNSNHMECTYVFDNIRVRTLFIVFVPEIET